MVDTGASISIISSHLWKKMGSPSLQSCNNDIVCYDGHRVRVLGRFTPLVQINGNQEKKIALIVVESTKPYGLVGRDYIHLTSTVASQVNEIQIDTHQLPPIQGIKADIHLKPDAKPRFCAARPVPLALKEETENELRRLVNFAS